MKTLILFILTAFFVTSITAKQNKGNIVSYNNVLSIAMHDNYLWLGTTGGIVKYDKASDEFTNYTKANDSNIQGYLGNIIRSVTVNSAGEVFATGDGLLKYDGTNWQRFTSQNSMLPYNDTHCVSVDKNDHVWIGSGEYVCRIENNTWSVFQLMDASALSYFAVNEIAFDSKNVAWAGTSHGLFKIENNIVTKIESFLFGEIFSLKVDANDRIMIATKSKGLVIYLPQDGSVLQYNTDNSNIGSNYIQHIEKGKDNSFWLTAAKLTLFSNDKFTTFTDKDLVLTNLSINRILYDQDVLWIGTAKDGLLKYDLSTNVCTIKNIDITLAVFDPLIQNNNQLTIYPNPVEDHIFVKTNLKANERLQTSLFELNGKLVHSFSESTAMKDNQTLKYNLGGLLLANQQYIIMVSGKQGQFAAKFLYKPK